MAGVFALMVLVLASIVLLVLGDLPAVRSRLPGLHRLARGLWLATVVAGWLAVGWVIVAYPGGVEAAWEWVFEQTVAVQGAMWLLLLPWMGALWVWNESWPLAVRTAIVIALAVGTLLLSRGSGKRPS